jgi:predicted lipoprotein with Yx(FWY)xxD motif
MERSVARCGAGPRWQLVLVLAAIAVLASTAAFATAATPAGGGRAHVKASVRIAHTEVGPLVVNGSGDTVYMFVRDKHGKDECLKIKGCEKDWPAVTTTGKPVAGPGLKKSLLGSIPYLGKPKGTLREVTYKGHPLHTYRFDTSRGSVINIGNRQFGGAWYALNANGGVIK